MLFALSQFGSSGRFLQGFLTANNSMRCRKRSSRQCTTL